MESKFTPGPLIKRGLHIMKEGKTGSISQSFIINNNYDKYGKMLPDLESQANSALWAASPDLYYALTLIKNTYTDGQISEQHLKIIFNALDKANKG